MSDHTEIASMILRCKHHLVLEFSDRLFNTKRTVANKATTGFCAFRNYFKMRRPLVASLTRDTAYENNTSTSQY